MSNDRYIPGVPCWVDATQPDPAAAGEFYAGLFGWELEDVMPPGAPGRYLTARIGGGDVAAVGSIEHEGQTAGWHTYVWVEDADATAARAREAGGRVLEAPAQVADAGRMAVLADPQGAEIRLWEPARHRGATVVNEHGAVVFNDLRTGDVDAARPFYEQVFGWRTLDWGGGVGMWTLPGYGRFLETLRPGTLAGMKEMGAPEGFEDTVASYSPLGPGEDGPRWQVTFAVDDADAAARRAAELGGRVLGEPHDAPWVRDCVLADPAGAVFTASQFKPENREAPTGSASGAAS